MRPVCQLCKKTGHTVLRCWKHFDHNYTGEEKMVNNAEGHRHNVDPAWYSNIGAIDHIMSDLDKLAMYEKYTGQEIHVANGGGMQITHVSNSILVTPSRVLSLKNVLYDPTSHKNLVYVHHFTRDNHVYIQYHLYFCLVKDPHTRKVLLHSKCRGGLYPFSSLEQSSSSKCVLSVVKPSLSRWHERLGHPSMVIVQRVVGHNKLDVSQESNKSPAICDAYQCAKSYQLLFARLSSVSKAPLELVFLDVWGPASSSVGRNNYYMSFIDDYSKFIWIFLKYKSEVFAKFHMFQQHVDWLLNRKIKAVQTDWRGIKG
jgi:hypothetical protein